MPEPVLPEQQPHAGDVLYITPHVAWLRLLYMSNAPEHAARQSDKAWHDTLHRYKSHSTLLIKQDAKHNMTYAFAGPCNVAVNEGDEVGRPQECYEKPCTSQPKCKLLVFPYGKNGLVQADAITSALQSRFPGLESVNGFEAFDNLHQAEMSMVYYHGGVIPSLAHCWTQSLLPTQDSFVQRLQRQDAQHIVTRCKSFLDEAARSISSVFWLNSCSSTSLSLFDYSPFSQASAGPGDLWCDQECFVNITYDNRGVVPDMQQELQQFLSGTTQRLAVLVSSEEDAAGLPELLDELPVEQTAELRHLISQPVTGGGKWPLASLVAVLLHDPQDMDLLGTSPDQETVALAVILHIKCTVLAVAGQPALASPQSVDVRLDATTQRASKGGSLTHTRPPTRPPTNPPTHTTARVYIYNSGLLHRQDSCHT